MLISGPATVSGVFICIVFLPGIYPQVFIFSVIFMFMVVFKFKILFMFKVIFIFAVVLINEVVFIFEVVFTFEIKSEFDNRRKTLVSSPPPLDPHFEVSTQMFKNAQ